MTEVADEPAIGVSFKHTLDDYREIVFQGYIPIGCSDGQFNELLDKLSRASDRQKAKTHLPSIRTLLEIKKTALNSETQALFSLQSEQQLVAERWKDAASASGRRAPKPGPQERQEHIQLAGKVAQSEQNLAVLKKEVEAYTRQLSDMETKLGEP